MTQEAHNSALLVMDVQPGIVERLDDSQAYIKKVTAAVAAAHKNNIPVIYVVVGFRPDFPEVSPSNKSFGAIKESGRNELVDSKPVLPLSDGDLVVLKHRVSAFSGSDLEMVLRAQGINHLLLCGIATSGVVLSTVREAADKDFALTVLSDLSADFDPAVHDVLIEKVFPRQADVITSDEWLAQRQQTDAE
jgi:nicotinamidase-related amidase